MSRSLALRAVAHARLTVIIVAAVLAGAAGGAWATGVAPSPVQILTVADETAPEESSTAEEKADKAEKAEKTEKAERSEQAPKADKPDKTDKPEKADRAVKAEGAEGAQGVHGACVSAVAKDKDAIGGKNDNHGGAVSKAAHDCPH